MPNLVTEYSCPECGKTLKTPQGLVKHALMKHEETLTVEEARELAVQVEADDDGGRGRSKRSKRSWRQRLGFTEFHPVLLVIGLVILAAGVPAACYITRKFERKAEKTYHWPSTKGVILTSEVKEPEPDTAGKTRTHNRTHVPRVSYRYTVNGRVYQDNRPTIGTLQGKQASEEFVARFPVGAKVTVYYDPKDPARAVLVRGMGGRNTYWVAVPLVVAMGLILVIGAFREYTG